MNNSNETLLRNKRIMYWLMTQCVNIYDEFKELNQQNQTINIVETLKRRVNDLDIVVICDYILLLVEFIRCSNDGHYMLGIDNMDQYYLLYDIIRFINDILLKRNDEVFTTNMIHYFNNMICSKFLRYPFCDVMTVCYTLFGMLYKK